MGLVLGGDCPCRRSSGASSGTSIRESVVSMADLEWRNAGRRCDQTLRCMRPTEVAFATRSETGDDLEI